MKTLALIFGVINGVWGLIVKLAIVILVIVGIWAFVSSCMANATLNEHSSCQQFEQADTSTQDQVLEDMLAAHHDPTGLTLVRASVSLYCEVHDPSSPIDGVYNSSNTVSQPLAQARHIELSFSKTGTVILNSMPALSF